MSKFIYPKNQHQNCPKEYENERSDQSIIGFHYYFLNENNCFTPKNYLWLFIRIRNHIESLHNVKIYQLSYIFNKENWIKSKTRKYISYLLNFILIGGRDIIYLIGRYISWWYRSRGIWIKVEIISSIGWRCDKLIIRWIGVTLHWRCIRWG